MVQSTADAEFVASACGMLEAEGIERLLEGLGNDVIKVIPPLFNDNQSAIQNIEVGSNYQPSGHHVGVRYYGLKDAIAKFEIMVKYCSTDDIVVDIFIMCLPQIKQEEFRAHLDMRTFE